MKIRNCNWPELSLYCGCCKLSTGIYIRSALSVVLLSSLSVLVLSNMIRLLRLSQDFHSSANQTVLVEYLDINVSPTNYDSLIIFFKTVIFFHIFWLALRALFTLNTLALCYAVYKSKVAMLKVLLLISIPCSIFDVTLSILGLFLFRQVLKIVLVVFYLSEGYNLLAIYSEYKRISGTSRIIRKEDIGEPNIRCVPLSDHFSLERHCDSCTCFVPDSSTPISGTVETHLSTPCDVNGGNVENDLAQEFNEVTDGRCENVNFCGRSEEIAVERVDPDYNAEKKENISDAPVIYDEVQLRTSDNAIIESR